MVLVRVGASPDEPLAAAAHFHAEVLPDLAIADDAPLTLVFGPADHTHRAWRLAAVQGLARRLAPRRVNAIAGEDELAIAATDAYLTRSPGITGQYLTLAVPDRSA